MKLNLYIHINIMSDLDKATIMSSLDEPKEMEEVKINVDDDNEVDEAEDEEVEVDEAEVGDAEVDDAEDDDEADDEEEEDEDEEADDDDEEEDEDVDDDDDDNDEDVETEDANTSLTKTNKTKKSKKKIITTEVDNVLGTSLVGPETIETTVDDYNSDDDDEYEAEDFQKLDDEMRKNYILMNHPESMTQNYDEIYKLSKTVRNKNNIIVDAAHRTIPMLTKYEKARILGVRAKQINNGAAPFIELKENIIDGYLIAERELAEKKLPFIIRRPLPNRGSEYWRLEDLEII